MRGLQVPAGAALIGGETAEMPGVYAPGEFDVVGFLVGVVARKKIWPRNVAAGDVLHRRDAATGSTRTASRS